MESPEWEVARRQNTRTTPVIGLKKRVAEECCERTGGERGERWGGEQSANGEELGTIEAYCPTKEKRGQIGWGAMLRA